MSSQAYLIDTNVIIGLEDNKAVQPAFAALLATAAKYKVDVLVHEAAKDDINRDRNEKRKKVSLSKLDKFQILKKVRGLTKADLDKDFGTLAKPNDVVDATLLDALVRGAADFLVTEDGRLHARARRHSPELGPASSSWPTPSSCSRPLTSPKRRLSDISKKCRPMKSS